MNCKLSNLKKDNVILYKTEHKSFAWNNGLFIILAVKPNGDLSMCKLDNDGNPQLFDDGRFMETITGWKNNNPNLFPTNLKYTLPKIVKKS